jgi:hypothetical protein
VCAGFLDAKFGDLLLTALFVLAATMLLGALRPQRPWRWTLLVAAFVPLIQLIAYAVLTEKPYRAQIYESFLGFLTGIAGAYGGATARRGLEVRSAALSSQLLTPVILSAACSSRNARRATSRRTPMSESFADWVGFHALSSRERPLQSSVARLGVLRLRWTIRKRIVHLRSG